jgi:hypothetical protein
MSGIDSPIKKLKRLSMKEAQLARAAARQAIREQELLMEEGHKKTHEENIELALSELRKEFIPRFEAYKRAYAQGDTDDPILIFVYNNRNQDACHIFIAEVEESFAPKLAKYQYGILRIEVSVVDETEESKMNK